MKVKFKEWDCVAVPRFYDNGRHAILLVDAEDKEPIAKSTVNIPEATLGEHQVIIKDYSENEGMVRALIDAGIIEAENDGLVTAGHCMVPIHDLTPAYMEAIKA